MVMIVSEQTCKNLDGGYCLAFSKSAEENSLTYTTFFCRKTRKLLYNINHTL